MYIIRYRTLLLRSYFCKKRKARVKAKTVLKRWIVCSSNHYRVRLFYFFPLAGGRKKKMMGGEPNVALCIDIDMYLYMYTLYTH